MAKKKKEEGASESASDSDTALKVKFIKLWTSKRGYFRAGQVAELPATIAESLEAEGVVEIVESDEE